MMPVRIHARTPDGVPPSEESFKALGPSLVQASPDPKGKRLIGFDNAHGVRAPGGKKKRKGPAVDHWHRTERDKGRPYAFKDAETLVGDFFAEVERVLMEHGVPFDVVEADDEGAMI